MSLLDTQDAILTQLQTLSGPRTVEAFAGDLDALLRDTSPRPALHLLYAGAAFGEQETLGGPVQPIPARRIWTVLIAVSGRRSAADTNEDAMVLIDAVRSCLAGFVVDDGHLWPLADEFLKSKNGVLVYGVDFVIDTEE
ncbi:Gp37 family protein [Desulfocastanea catecholica]